MSQHFLYRKVPALVTNWVLVIALFHANSTLMHLIYDGFEQSVGLRLSCRPMMFLFEILRLETKVQGG